VNRPLHPLLVGAGRYYKSASEKFTSFTVIDSQPFMQALSRQMLVCTANGKYCWEAIHSKRGAPLDDFIENNLLYYEEKLKAGMEDETDLSLPKFSQSELGLPTSTPYLTAQP
jgi:hypothetical protein